MPVLIATVAVVGGLCVLDLLLTFGVIRRLREHSRLLSTVAGTGSEVTGLAVGQTPGEFFARTTAGDPVTGTGGLRVVAFFSASCSVCPQRVPPFVSYLSGHRIAPQSVLAVVEGDPDAPPPYVSQLAGVARVCVEPAEGELTQAFRISAFPAFCMLDESGALLASGYDVSVLSQPAAV